VSLVRLRPVWMTNHPPSVLWHCELGHQTCQNRRPYNLYCVGADVKPCSINQSTSSMSIHPSICPQDFSNLNEIWYVSRGRWVLHGGMSYDLIQGQGHGSAKVVKIDNFDIYLLRRYGTPKQYLNFVWTDVWYSSSFNVMCTTVNVRVFWGVDQQSHMGLMFLLFDRMFCSKLDCNNYISSVVSNMSASIHQRD